MAAVLNSPIIIFIPTEREFTKVFKLPAVNISDEFSGIIYNNIPIIITGAGKTNACLTAARVFQQFAPRSALLMGICGAYQNSSLNIGDVVCITKDYFVDECVFDGKTITTLAEKHMPLCHENCATFEKTHFLKAVSSNSVSFIAATDYISNLYTTKTGAQTENMEGAAFGTACAKYNIKAYQIRAVSNFCGDAEKQKWNITKAATNLKTSIDYFLK